MKNESLEIFLSNLTDRELAFFTKFRQKEFMPESQHKIQSELKKRNLSDLGISGLTKEIEQVKIGNCPRCGSNNFQEITDTELRSTKYGGYEIEIISRSCRICSYNAQKDKPINWKVRLRKFLGKYAWKRLK
jgi:predicted Zn-ribbon and HTH transcriptional regulator